MLPRHRGLAARCGRSAECWLCGLWAVSAAVLGGGGGGGHCGGKQIIIKYGAMRTVSDRESGEADTFVAVINEAIAIGGLAVEYCLRVRQC